MTVFTPADNAGFPTFADAKNSALADIAGACNNKDQFRSYVNQGTERLLYRGDWRLSVLPIQVQVHRGIVTMPRMVGSIRQFNLCGRDVPVWSQWYRFLEHRWRGDQCFGIWTGWLGESSNISQYGYSATYAPIPSSTCVLQIQGVPDDNGKVIQFFGLDPSGNQLQTDNGDGTFSDGISLTLGQPFTVGTQLVGTITRVIKPITQSYIQCFALDTASGVQTQIANWEPSLTNPSYQQYRLQMQQCDTTKTFTAVALVKIKFVPVLVDSDPVQIPNLGALKLMVQGIRMEDANDDDGAQKKIFKAVHELNLQLQDDIQDDQIPIVVNPFGTASPSRAGIGRVI